MSVVPDDLMYQNVLVALRDNVKLRGILNATTEVSGDLDKGCRVVFYLENNGTKTYFNVDQVIMMERVK